MASSQVETRLNIPPVRKMDLCDAKCPVCFCILIEPVTMPCKHELCRPCFENTIRQTSLTCPMCRTRFASWARRATREDQLINQKKWTQIQKDFPERVRKRILGLDDSLPGDDIARSLSEPGEIRKEYEEQMKQVAEEREKNEKLSAKSILNLINRWKEEAENASKKTELIISRGEANRDNSTLAVKNVEVKIAEQFKKHAVAETSGSPSKEQNLSGEEPNNKSHQVKRPTLIPLDKTTKLVLSNSKNSTSNMEPLEESVPGTSSGNERKRSGSAQSNDSITEELCHFKPIKVAPKTPPKKMPDGRVIYPPLVQTRPLNLVRAIPSTFNPLPCSSFAQKLVEVCSDRQDYKNFIGAIKTSDESAATDASLHQEFPKPLLPLEPNLPLTEQTSSYKAPATRSPFHLRFQQSSFSNTKIAAATSIAFQDCSQNNNENSLTGNEEPRSKRRKAISLGGGHTAESKQVKTKPSLAHDFQAELPSLKSELFVKEQMLLLEHLKQEDQDRKMALELQKKFDMEAEMFRRGKIGYREPYILRKKRLPPVTVVSGRRRSQC